MPESLTESKKYDTLTKDFATQQIVKLMRRLQALPNGRHEIILTVENGVQDWTVRTLGKVER